MGKELIPADVPAPKCYLLRARNGCALPLLHGMHEIGGVQQGFMGPVSSQAMPRPMISTCNCLSCM
jgi:hypothetical protein